MSARSALIALNWATCFYLAAIGQQFLAWAMVISIADLHTDYSR